MASFDFLRQMVDQNDQKHDRAHERIRKDLEKTQDDVDAIRDTQQSVVARLAVLPDRDALKQLLHSEYAAARSMKKNGDGWLGYLGRIITFERVMWVLAAIYVLGGRVNQAQTDIAAALKQATTAERQTRDVLAAVDANQRSVEQAVSELQSRSDATITKDEMAVALKGLQEQLKSNMTRGEFERLVNQTLLPRMGRIEEQQKRFLERNPDQ